MKFVAFLFLVMINMTLLQNAAAQQGKGVYVMRCTKCHGKNGSKGLFGAKDLTRTKLAADAAKEIISNGKGLMPAWKERLSPEEISAVLEYVFSLRK